MNPERHVLISNDDGYNSEGLRALTEVVAALPGFRVSVVAPNDQQSGTSHSLTLTSPLRIIERGERRWSVTGTPTDTVLIALEKILADDPPDLVLSGINHGPNMGEDVMYSGTVAAAMEGTVFGVPSYALSLNEWHPTEFEGARAFLTDHLEHLLAFPLRRGTLLNVNLPPGGPEAYRGIRVTHLGSRVYTDAITDKVDPHGRPYYWIGGKGPTWQQQDGTDHTAVDAGYVSLTPLMIDLTNYGLLQEMKELERDLPGAGREAAADE